MAETMPAVAYRANLPVTDPDCLVDVVLPVPTPGPRDLLVRVEAVSVNPVDVKIRGGRDPEGADRVIGWDAAGVVVALGSEVAFFAVGDEVYSTGEITRPGSNSRFFAVDERIAGRKPATLSFPEAAALPLTAITAWESLFDKFRLRSHSEGVLLVLGGAGGVGSILIQLARALTGVTVVATASRPESRDWVLSLGAHHVVDHHDLAAGVRAVTPGGVDCIFSPHTAGQIEAFAELLVPGGQVVAIDEPPGLDLVALKPKSITWHWELMFTRAMFGTADLVEQHDILMDVADLVDAGKLRTTMTTQLQPFDAQTMRQAHELVESGRTIGKVVVSF
jgi:zinc-binding alcohol dehydrogenase family protein